MIQGLYESVQNTKHKGIGLWSYQYKINKLTVNLFYPVFQSFNKKKGIDENSDVVVSLTTYPARINTVWITVASLLNQSYKPAKVLLYLSKEQFPAGFEELPKKLLQQQQRGLEIVFVEDDLKPHKKYFYALQEYKDKMVITADDDIFYPENHVEQFVKASKKYPEAVICSRSHRMELDVPYNAWKNNTTDDPDIMTMPIGCNGILYKAKFFDEELFNVGAIKENALYTDDLWLKIMELKSGTKAYNYSHEPLIYFDNIFNKNTGLWHTNASADSNRNDLVWEKLIKLYPANLE